jgi:methionine-rich copper-binding protein CopC
MNKTHRNTTILRSLLLLLMALCFNNNAPVHIAIENTTPAADETVKTAPSELVLEFMHPVILTTLTLVDDTKGANININFKAGGDLANRFMLPLPTLGKQVATRSP